PRSAGPPGAGRTPHRRRWPSAAVTRDDQVPSGAALAGTGPTVAVVRTAGSAPVGGAVTGDAGPGVPPARP
ncbi:hypothetical protein AB0L10_45550, partial [Streptomyces flaveolus]|uniref:hypothetical protein n=1 Tax=Streptomyces flaveolus TaxID=67297 RepID=UPI00342F6909